MRKALNENRTVQIAVVGVLAVVIAVIFLLNMGGGADDGAGTAATGVDPAESVVGPDSSPGSETDPGAAPPVESVPTGGKVPIGPELPARVTAAYDRGDAIILLVVREGGLEDGYVERSLSAVRGEPGISVFVTTTDRVAEYARLTQGAGVSRAPALVVVRPKHISGESPRAQVHYGLRSPESVRQAVRDAYYAGGATTYGPDH